ncbi:unnamed protein product, partial [Mesorhabditis belari]|uniref:C-type lectin domain-containing protein n=1 Tax=Mesorhabditis belari TaxID=2138241 RepID=A0AAF3EPT6_9BILA
MFLVGESVGISNPQAKTHLKSHWRDGRMNSINDRKLGLHFCRISENASSMMSSVLCDLFLALHGARRDAGNEKSVKTSNHSLKNSIFFLFIGFLAGVCVTLGVNTLVKTPRDQGALSRARRELESRTDLTDPKISPPLDLCRKQLFTLKNKLAVSEMNAATLRVELTRKQERIDVITVEINENRKTFESSLKTEIDRAELIIAKWVEEKDERLKLEFKFGECEENLKFSNESSAQCPKQWIYNKETEACYFLQNFTHSDGIKFHTYARDLAEHFCQNHNAHLASIHSKNEEDFIRELISSNLKNSTELKNEDERNEICEYAPVWIGLTGNGHLGDNRNEWIDGSSFDYSSARTADGIYLWDIANDEGCGSTLWNWRNPSKVHARFLCKQPSTSERQLQAADSKNKGDDVIVPIE